MTERTALLAMEAIDKDRQAVGMSVHMIMHILHDYIPYSCRREAENKLFDEMFISGTELTSNTMRKQYEYWKTTQLDLSMLSTKPTMWKP